MYKQGIEVKKEIDLGVIFEKPSLFSFVEYLYPKSRRIHYPNDQDDLIYIDSDGVVVGFVAGHGSSVAACVTERLRVYGARAIIRIGMCGALSRSVKLWTPIITTACFSNEGTSGHYLPKGYPIISDANLNDILIKKISEAGIDYQRGITITTDGRWREDPVLLKEASELGAVSIEMETAAVLSVCQFRKIPAAAINIPADLPAEEDDKNDLKGVPNMATYNSDIKKIMTKMIPVVVDTLKDYHKKAGKKAK